VGPAIAALDDLAGVDEATLLALWPALAGQAGLRLDRRGTARLAAFTRERVRAWQDGRSPAGSATVAGGRVWVERRGPAGAARWVLVVRAGAGDQVRTPERRSVALAVRGGSSVRFGGWTFRVLGRPPSEAELAEGRACWLEAGPQYAVRAWRPGDRWHPGPALPARRVKRFLADRHVPAAARAGWPVVALRAPAGAARAAAACAGDEIVWVPGVRRSSAAPARPGQPGFYLLCERTPGRHGADDF
jgi:tRNA(Ile)-lysidine synthetase-like protein